MKRFAEHKEQAFTTLSLFDNMNLVTRTRVPDAYYSVGLWDAVCPPSNVYASYNHLPNGVQKG